MSKFEFAAHAKADNRPLSLIVPPSYEGLTLRIS